MMLLNYLYEFFIISGARIFSPESEFLRILICDQNMNIKPSDEIIGFIQWNIHKTSYYLLWI